MSVYEKTVHDVNGENDGNLGNMGKILVLFGRKTPKMLVYKFLEESYFIF